jgi:hypothetical protein
MADVLISSDRLLDRLAREEQQMKFLGLHGNAAGVRAAITILIRHTEEAKQPQPPAPSIDSST